MPAPTASIIRGDTSVPVLIGRRIKKNADTLDTGTLNFVSVNEDEFQIGQVIDQLPGLYVDSVDSNEQGGGLWEHAVEVIGKLGGERRMKGFPDIQYALTDWDRVEDSWITSNADKIKEGQVGNFGGTVVCLNANSKRISPGWYEVRGSFVGLIRPKPRQRTITVNGQTISGERLVINLPGGWSEPQKGQAQLPKIVVKDRYLGFTPPPTHLIPGPAVPPNPPSVNFFTVTGQDVTRYWPGGWHLASLAGEQIADKGLHAVDWIYEYQYPVTP